MPLDRREQLTSAQRRMHLLAVPLALLGLGVGMLLIFFDPVTIARRGVSGSRARTGPEISGDPVLLPIAFTSDELRRVRQLGPLPALPPDSTNGRADDPRAARFGHALFFDASFSDTGALSCASCHDPRRWFTDGLRTSRGMIEGTRNTLSLVNAAFNRWFDWDGRHDSAWSQALEPLERENEMGGNRVAIVRRIARDPEYRAVYEALFGPLPPLDGRAGGRIPEAAKPMPDAPEHPLNMAWESMSEADRERINRAFVNVGKALAAHQRLLLDHSSSFDRFLAGLSEDGTMSSSPLSPSELRGLRLFIGRANCFQCHHGPMLSDGEFHNIGLPVPPGTLPRDPGRYTGVDLLQRNEFRASGRFSDDREGSAALLTEAVINSPENWGRFRTPSLRGVTQTAPYMHTGQFASLVEVIRFYSTLEGAVQLDHHQETMLEPLFLTEDEIEDLVHFLSTLSGSGPRDDLIDPPVGPRGPISGGRSLRAPRTVEVSRVSKPSS